jgi:hypothetical protein
LFFDGKITIKQLNNVFLHESYSWEAEQLINDGAYKINKIKLEELLEQQADKHNSQLMQIMKRDKLLFTQNYNYETILNLIQRSEIIEEGDLLVSLFELKFPNGNIIYFSINSDTPKTIIDIWLPSGNDYTFGKRNHIVKLCRPGIINDRDGFTNIRKEADANSQIVGKFVTNELFFFTPVSGSNWWPVYKNETSPCVGYIYKNKITFYKDFPEVIKKKVIKMRTGC